MGSFSFDLSGMITTASSLFNSLIPIVALVGGLMLGIGLVGFVLNLIGKII